MGNSIISSSADGFVLKDAKEGEELESETIKKKDSGVRKMTLSHITDVDDIISIQDLDVFSDYMDDNGIGLYLNKNDVIEEKPFFSICGLDLLIDNITIGNLSKKDLEASEESKYFNFLEITSEPGTKTNMHDLLSNYRDDINPILKRIETNPEEISSYNEEYQTPLICACKMKNLASEVIKKMLEANPEAASIPDYNGSYPLHHYVSSDKKHQNKIISLLINQFPDALVCRNRFGGTPLIIAIASDAAYSSLFQPDDVLMTLIKANPAASEIPDIHGNYALHYVGRNSKINLNAIESLISHCPSALWKQNAYGATPIFLAVYWDAPIEIMTTLLKASPQVVTVKDERGLDAISSAWNLFVRKTRVDNENLNKKTTNKGMGNREIMIKAETPFDLKGDVLTWWKKMELLLKSSHSKYFSELPEPRVWRILHAALGTQCPPNLVRFTIKLYRNQVFLKDEMGRLPLHIAARTPMYVPQVFEPKANTAPLIAVLAQINPNAVKEKDNDGRLPLHFALEAGKTWDEGIDSLIKFNPQSIREKDPITHLYPFMLAATNDFLSLSISSKAESIARSRVKVKEWKVIPEDQKESEKKQIINTLEMNMLNTIYQLLHEAPDVLSKAVNGFTESKEKKWLRESNEKLRKQISEMRPAYIHLNEAMKEKKKIYEDEIKELKSELAGLQRLSLKAHKSKSVKSIKKSTTGLSRKKRSKR